VRFWEAYPRKVGKQDALRAWNKLAPDDALLAVMLAALERQKSWDEWTRDKGRYIPHPATWLNGRRWEDQQPEELGHRPAASTAEFVRQAAESTKRLLELDAQVKAQAQAKTSEPTRPTSAGNQRNLVLVNDVLSRLGAVPVDQPPEEGPDS
jgi:hypothetical protein